EVQGGDAGGPRLEKVSRCVAAADGVAGEQDHEGRAVLRRTPEKDARCGEVTPHPQVQRLLEAVSNSPFPALSEVPAFVARRLYAERCRIVRPAAPEMQVKLLLTPGGTVVRSYRPANAAKTDVLPALVYYHGGGWTIGDLDTHDTLCRQ